MRRVILFRPLTHWPAGRMRTSATDQIRALFKSTYESTLSELDNELRIAGVPDDKAVLQVDVESERDIRNDGFMARNARMRSSAVVLTFPKTIGDRAVPVTFACDRFDQWDHNLRAIALGMGDLRRVERYGITAAGEQYRGFAALPSSTTPAISITQAAEILAKRSTVHGAFQVQTRLDAARAAFQSARAKAHPDAGGSAAEFNLVTEAARVLAAHHGVERL